MSEIQANPVRPAVDIFENEAEIVLVGDVPGVEREGLDLRLEKGCLTLEARSVNSEHAYSRSFEVPEDVDRAKISADLVDGVLSIHLPKRESERSRRVEIKSPPAAAD